MDKIPLTDFFERTDFNNIKGLDSLIFPRLFDLCLTGPAFNWGKFSIEVQKSEGVSGLIIYT